MANDIIVIEYQANIKNLEANLNKVENELLAVEASSKDSMGTLSKESNKAAASVDKIDKQVKGLKGALSDLASNLPFAGAIQQAQQFATSLTAVGTAATGSAVGTAALGTSLTATSVAAGVAATAMKVLRVALISTGIGALVVAFGSLIAYFKSTEEGSEKLERGLASIGAAVEAVIGRFAKLGQGIVQLFSGEFKAAAETFSTSFTGIGDEISKASAAASEFTRKLQDIEDAEKLLSVKVAKTRLEIEKLNIQARNRTTSDEERLKLLDKAEEKERAIVKEQIDLQQQKVDALAEENKLKIESGKLDKGNKTDELIAAEIKLIELQGESDKVLEKIGIRQDMLLQDRLKKLEEERKIRERLNQENVKDLDTQAKLDADISTKRIKLKEIETKEISKILDDALERDYQKAQEDVEKRRALRLQAVNTALDITGQLSNAIVEQQLQAETIEIQNEQKKNDTQYNNLVKSLEQKRKAGLISEEQYNKEKERLDIQAARKSADLKKKQFKAEQDAKIKQIAIDTAVAVIKTYTSYGGFTPAAILAIAGLVASSAIQVAKIRSTPVPEFEKGGKVEAGKLTGNRHSQGGIMINAEGGEWIMDRKNTGKHESALEAMSGGYFDKYVNQNYVVPAMRKAEERERALKRRSANTADNLMKALELNGFGDMSHLERLTKSNKSVNVANLHTLPSAIGKEFSRAISNKNYMK